MANTPISQIPNGQAISPVSAAAVYTIDGAVIGSVTPLAGTFTTITAPTAIVSAGRFTTVSASTPISVGNGGTGVATITTAAVVIGNGTGPFQSVAPGTSGNFLTSTGTAWASTAPSSSNTLVLLSTLTASSSATIDFTSAQITATYKEYIVKFINVTPINAGDELRVRVSQSGTFRATLGDYGFNLFYSSSADGNARIGDLTSTSINIARFIGEATGEGLSGELHFYDPTASSSFKKITSFISAEENVDVMILNLGCSDFRLNQNACDGIRFFFEGGNIASGTFKLYGVL